MSYAPVHYAMLGTHCGYAGFGQAEAPPAATGESRTGMLVFGGIMVGLGFLAYLRFKTTSDIARTRGVNEALKYEAGMAGIRALNDLTRPVSRNRRRGRRRRR
jgi:hypothetical protein